MTVETTLTKKMYEGNGIAKVFAIPFPVQDADQVQLLLSANGIEIPVTTNYQINRDSSEAIVSVTYPVVGNALSTGIKFLIYRDTVRKQIADITNAGAYHPEVVEHVGLDRIVMMIQELQEALDRALKVPITSDKTPEELMNEIFSFLAKLEYYLGLLAGYAKDAQDAAIAASAASNWNIIPSLKWESDAARQRTEHSLALYGHRTAIHALQKTATADSYRLFIVAGGDNALGQSQQANASAGDVALYWDAEKGELLPLIDPVGAVAGSSRRGSAWPRFARELFRLTNVKTVILNAGISNLAVTNPDASSSAQAAIAAAYSDFARYASNNGVRYELGGILWCQGEADVAAIVDGSVTVDDFKAATRDFLIWLRALMGDGALPAFIARIGYTGDDEKTKDACDAMRAAQGELCDAADYIYDGGSSAVDFWRASQMQQNGLYYTQDGYNTIGKVLAHKVKNLFSWTTENPTNITVHVVDQLRRDTEQASDGKRTIIRNVDGTPSVMWVLPKFYLSQLNDPVLNPVVSGGAVVTDGSGKPKFQVPDTTNATLLTASGGQYTDAVHPAFIIGGKEVPELFLGCYAASLVNGKAVSIGNRYPKVEITFDQAINYARASGGNFHVMTNAEWAAIALWCWRNGYNPGGNSCYGINRFSPWEVGVLPVDPFILHSKRPILGNPATDMPIYTGSGPVTWNHDGTASGIADLAGNILETTPGCRLVDGEIQIIVNNDAAIPNADFSATSTAWRAMLVDGTLVAPGSSDTLKFDDNGTGSAEAGDYVFGDPILSTVVTHPTYEDAVNIGSSAEHFAYMIKTNDHNSRVDPSIESVPKILEQLCIMGIGHGVQQGRYSVRNTGEMMMARGGAYYYDPLTRSLTTPPFIGLFSATLANKRNVTGDPLGFRVAYYT